MASITVKIGVLRGFSYIVLISGSIVMLLPFLWMISTSLKTFAEALAMPPTWIPDQLMWSNFPDGWAMAPFARFFINSVVISVTTAGGGVILSVLAAYAFAKMNFFGKNVVFIVMIGTMMIPGMVLLVPNFLTMVRLGWIDTYHALIIPWLASVFVIFLLRQFFMTIPNELWDSAQIDGCGRFHFLWRFIIPLSKPALFTAFLLRFIGSWNAFLWVLIMTNREEMRTVPVGLALFAQEAGTEYQLMMAMSTLAIIPIMVLFFACQRQFIEGVARTGIK
jgi:multiple sugar transport system permease protein